MTLKLARDYDRYKAIAERHGIEISARRVRHVLDQVEREREQHLGLAPGARADHRGAACAPPARGETRKPPADERRGPTDSQALAPSFA